MTTASGEPAPTSGSGRVIAFLGLALRLGLGGLLAFAGAMKLTDPAQFALGRACRAEADREYRVALDFPVTIVVEQGAHRAETGFAAIAREPEHRIAPQRTGTRRIGCVLQRGIGRLAIVMRDRRDRIVS